MKKRYQVCFFLLIALFLTQVKVYALTSDKYKNIPIDKVWKVTFTSKLSPSSINRNNFYIYDSQYHKIDANPILSDDGYSVNIIPNENFSSNSKYTLFVFKGIQNIHGNSLDKDISIDFYTSNYASNEDNLKHDITKSVVSIKAQTDYGIIQGSGFFISQDGILVTNYHVIETANAAVIIDYNNNKFYNPYVIGYDKSKDIAILKLKENRTNISYCKLGDSSLLKTGEKLYTVSSPYGEKNIISESVVSDILNDLIKFTSQISYDSSGGALLNSNGDVVGIMCQRNIDGKNTNTAISINTLETIKKDKYLTLYQLNKQNIDISLKVPTNLKAVSTSHDKLNLTWDKINEADYYHVYYSYTLDGPYSPYKLNGSKLKVYWTNSLYKIRIEDIDENTKIFFKVTSVKNNKESKFSTAVYAVTESKNSVEDIYYEIIQNGYFDNYSNRTIKSAFDDFFVKSKWTYYKSNSNEDIVNFSGKCRFNNEIVTVNLEFIVLDITAKSFRIENYLMNDLNQPASELPYLLDTIYGL